MSGMNIVRFPRTETCYTCTTCNRHLTDKSFLTVKDPWVLPKERDRTSECRVCDEIRRGAPIIHSRNPCNCGK